jgi:hypothetical protein
VPHFTQSIFGEDGPGRSSEDGGGSVASLDHHHLHQEVGLALAKSYQATLAASHSNPTHSNSSHHSHSNSGEEGSAVVPPGGGGILLSSLVTPPPLQRSPRNSLAVPHKVQFVENRNLRYVLPFLTVFPLLIWFKCLIFPFLLLPCERLCQLPARPRSQSVKNSVIDKRACSFEKNQVSLLLHFSRFKRILKCRTTYLGPP